MAYRSSNLHARSLFHVKHGALTTPMLLFVCEIGYYSSPLLQVL